MLNESVDKLKAQTSRLFEVEADPTMDNMDKAVKEMDAEPKDDEYSLELDAEGVPVEQPGGLEPKANEATGDEGAAPEVTPPKPATAERRELRTKFPLKQPKRYERRYGAAAGK